MRTISKWLTIILIFSAFLFSSLKYVNVSAYAASNGSTIGSVNVEDLSEKDMKKQIDVAIAEWKNAEIYITVGDRKVLLNSDDFLFNVDASIKQYENDTEKPWYAFWEKKPVVHEALIVEANASLIEKIESETNLKGEDLESQVLEAASYLKKSPIKVNVTDLSMKNAERISFQSIALKDTQISDISAIAKELDGVMIEPETPFSFNDIATKAGSNDDAMTIAASALYSAVLQSSFEITERHQADNIPAFVKPGYEATVSPFLEKDLQFISHSAVPAKIVASVKSNVLKIELYSLPGNPDVTVSEKNRITVMPRTIYRYSNNLAEGASKTVQQAKSGLQLLIYRTFTDENGESKAQLISQNYYAPKNEIIEKSSKQTATTTNSSTDGSGNSDGIINTGETVSTEDSNNGKDENSNTDPNSSKSSSTNSKEATKSKNGGSVPKGSYYNNSGDIVTPKDTK
ncbi:VanW family protein [Rummeliibacillus pycnus]|uniref:VanW family protein n=1 Tax=Rummeliibacillus pycnus TaxID=101070 RepID=UPI0037C80E57